MLLHGHQHPVGLLVVTYSTYGETFQAELSGVHHRAAGGAGDRQADFLDEVHIATIGNAGDGPAQHIKDVKADD